MLPHFIKRKYEHQNKTFQLSSQHSFDSSTSIPDQRSWSLSTYKRRTDIGALEVLAIVISVTCITQLWSQCSYNPKHSNTVTIWIPTSDSMGVQYSNGSHMTWRTIWIPDILEHRHFFSPVFRPPFEYLTSLVFRWWLYSIHPNLVILANIYFELFALTESVFVFLSTFFFWGHFTSNISPEKIKVLHLYKRHIILL